MFTLRVFRIFVLVCTFSCLSVKANSSMRTVINEQFMKPDIERKVWQFSDEGVAVKDGKCVISDNGQLLSRSSLPEGILEIRLSFTRPLTRGAVAWGFRHKYGARPRLTFSVEESMKLRASVYDDNGIRYESPTVPFDGKVHSYKIVWEPKSAVFYLDGKEFFRHEFTDNFTVSPRPITIYNYDSDAEVCVEEIVYRTSATDEQLAEVKNKYQFHIGSAKLKFVELSHIDLTELPEVPPYWMDRGYILFTRPYIQRIFQTDTPEAGEIINPEKGLSAFATPGEYEPVTFAAHALKDTKEYEVSVSDLADSKGNFITTDNITIGTVRSLNKRLLYNYNWSPEYIFMPVFIEGKKRVTIPAGTNAQFWLTVKVPRDAKPGRYFGTIEFASIYGPEGGIPSRIPLSFEVLPFTLKEPDRYSFSFWYPAGVRISEPGDIAEDFAEMRRHGINSVSGAISPGATAVEKGDNIVITGIDEKFRWFCQEYKKAEFTQPFLLAADIGSGWATGHEKDIQSKKWEEEYIRFTRSFISMMKKNKWPDVIFQPEDESAWKPKADQDRCVRSLRLLKASGAVTENDGPCDKFMIEDAGPWSDVWNINGGLCPLDKIKEYRAAGKKLWAYNNDIEGIRPELMRYAAGYWLWISGADGINNFGYKYRKGKSIYDDLSGEIANFVYYYPKTNNETGGPALSYEAFREGIDDIRYLLTWEDAVAKAKKAGRLNVAQKSEELVSKLLAKIKWSDRLRNEARWQRVFYMSTGQKAVVGDLKVTNNIDWADYDKIRRAIADQIIELINE